MKAADARSPAAFEGHVPPHDLSAEGAVLACVMVDPGDPTTHTPSSLERVADILRPEHFYSEANRRIYEACLDLQGRGAPHDSVQVATWLREHDRLDQVGGMPYLARTLLASVLPANARAYAQAVIDTHLVRQVILASVQTAAVGYLDYGDARTYALTSTEKLVQISESSVRTTTTEHVLEILKRDIRDLRDASQSGRGITGRPTGIGNYDRLTAGLHNGDLTIVAARPGVGKTSLVTGWAESVATGDPERAIAQAGVLLCSLEMPREQITRRMACSRGGVDLALLRSGNLSPADWERLFAASVALGRLPIWVDDQPAITMLELRAKARWAQMECARRVVQDRDGRPLLDHNGNPIRLELGLLAIDYLQLMTEPGHNTREQEVSAISRGLKALAKDLRLPVVALSQLNRAVETRGDKGKRPQLSDLRDSGGIEQDADNICFIYREWLHDRTDESKRAIAELILAKQRNGPTDSVVVAFDDRYTRFRELPDSHHYWDDPDQRTGS